jgi:hypothetical protein
LGACGLFEAVTSRSFRGVVSPGPWRTEARLWRHVLIPLIMRCGLRGAGDDHGRSGDSVSCLGIVGIDSIVGRFIECFILMVSVSY